MNIEHIRTIWGTEDYAIKIARSEEFQQAAHELSEFIKNLPLTNEQNDKLVELAVKQVQAAERGGFFEGFAMGKDFGDWDAKQRKRQESL